MKGAAEEAPVVAKRAKVRAFLSVAGWFVSTVVLITMNKVLMGEHFALPVFLTFLHLSLIHI